MKDLALILLAAGSSSRMRGSHKLLLPLKNEPIVTKTLGTYESIPFVQKIIVLGNQGDLVAGTIKRLAKDAGSLQFVRNDDFDSGMRGSLQSGIQALRPEVGGVMIALGDQPFIEAETLMKLVDAYAQASKETNPGSPRLFAPISDGKRGNPVIVARSLFEEILNERSDETADQGARFLFQKYPEAVELVEVGTPAIHMDIDTPEDYQKFQLRATELHL